MKREDLIIFILGLLLLVGMLLTIFFGGEKSMHGVGSLHDIFPGNSPVIISYSSILCDELPSAGA